MNAPGPNPNQAVTVEKSRDAAAARAAVPVWLMILLFLLLYWAMLYFDAHGAWMNPSVYSPFASAEEAERWNGPLTGGGGVLALGKAVYNKPSCVACHMADGKGSPKQYPPLVDSPWLKEAKPGRVIRIVLNGLNGPLDMPNGPYDGTMVPWKDVLSDEEIAAVLTYVRQSKEFANNAPEVTPAEVKAVRAKIASRTTAFTPAELMSVSPAD